MSASTRYRLKGKGRSSRRAPNQRDEALRRGRVLAAPIGEVERRDQSGVMRKGLHASVPLPNIHEMAGDSRRGSHRGTHQVRPAALALTTLEIPIGRACAALAGLQDVGVHAEAHAAAGLAPFKACLCENTVQAFFLGLNLPSTGSLHGRVLTEALTGGADKNSKGVQTQTSSPTATGARTVLEYEELDGVRYGRRACLTSGNTQNCFQ